MNNILIACDLDNTLIHSYKHKKDGDVCIEWIHDKEQGYAGEGVYELLAEVKKYAQFIPVTTRSIEQYSRIKWLKDTEPEYAVTTNGAILLQDGNKVPEWGEESQIVLNKYQKDLDDMLSLLEAEDAYIRRRKVDEMYVFSYCKEGICVEDKVREYVDKTRLDIEYSGKKIYFLPPQFNKGEAVKRLKKMFKPGFVIAAGDSEIDIPMLELADLAYCKESIIKDVNNKNKRSFLNERDLIKSVLRDIKQLS